LELKYYEEEFFMVSTKSDLRSLATAEGAMILDIAADEITTLNEGGGYIWERLRRGDVVDQIVADMARDTGQDVSVVAADVNEFVEQLSQKKLVSLQES
jgi:hypothetical protein